MNRPVIGLVGQVCAGKSTVAAAFRSLGAEVLDLDEVVRELYRQEEVKRELRERFGPGVFDPEGEVDRARLGTVVFSDPARLKELQEAVVFPRVAARTREQVQAFRASSFAPVLVVEGPTLFEAKLERNCDRLLFVAAPRARRESWALQRRGWNASELARREAQLMDEDEKRRRCHAVLENGGAREELEQRVRGLWSEWVAGGG